MVVPRVILIGNIIETVPCTANPAVLRMASRANLWAVGQIGACCSWSGFFFCKAPARLVRCGLFWQLRQRRDQRFFLVRCAESKGLHAITPRRLVPTEGCGSPWLGQVLSQPRAAAALKTWVSYRLCMHVRITTQTRTYPDLSNVSRGTPRIPQKLVTGAHPDIELVRIVPVGLQTL